MKPLLIIPPAPARWRALENLLGHKGPLWREDVEKRFTQGVPDAQDAFAVIADGGLLLANACVNKRGAVGVLGHVFARPEHRRRGHARQVIAAVVSWFDMLGGKWLYLGCPAALADGLYAKFGFRVLHRLARVPGEEVTMLRVAAGARETPFAETDGEIAVRDATRADWPLLVALLQHFPGPDPRVPLRESAVSAELAMLELFSRQERGTCRLLAAWRGDRIIGLASVATDALGRRTYAMLLPHNETLPPLREAVTAFAQGRGYEQVDFPLEALAATPSGAPQ